MELGLNFRIPRLGSGTKNQIVLAQAEEARNRRVSDLAKRQYDLEQVAIQDVTQLPDGAYIDLLTLARPVPDLLQDSFAAITSTFLVDQRVMPANQYLARSDEGGARKHTTYLLMTPDVFLAGRNMLDVAQRLKEDGHVNIRPLLTTGELIRAVHHRYSKGAEHGDATQTATQHQARKLLIQADRLGASDIHLETRDETAEVLFRINGRRHKMADISKITAEAMAQVLFNFVSSDGARKGSWNYKEVKDTSFDVWDDPVERTELLMRVRFHSTPIHPEGNFQVVMRILRPSKRTGGAKPMDKIGYTTDQLAQIDEMLVGGSGLVLVVGPTNSGKSSSLHSYVHDLFRKRGRYIKVPTIESPVENEIAGACQMSSGKEDFQGYLEASLRQDPDVVMVGEIREKLAASTVKDLVLAGHKILATLHVFHSALAAFARLSQLGVEKDLLTMPGFVSGVVYQRLIPVVCPHCALTIDQAMQAGLVHPSLLARLSTVCNLEEHPIRFVNDAGCSQCNHTGIIDRTPAAEVLMPDATFLNYIRCGNDNAAWEHWQTVLGKRVAYGLGVTALSHAIFKMRQGMLDPRDVETELGALRNENGD
ncbi:GspE/PulE family protein [Xylophilus sp. ASV27]|uniref:GspE/PulE family protein n=1 Tax=Xylophilus sp. ASV27 TaxID=2795129 RepID=UPI0018EAC2E2|nr:ATPase, T2SS/T4P/T4SS family [Xylophilus sp. ASV27]